MHELIERVTRIRATRPTAVAEALARRKRRPLLTETGSLLLVAADHTGRGIVKAGADPAALADRGELLSRLLTALSRPGVDGILATPDVVDELAILGALDDKLVFGSMNRGGLAGSTFELDDRFTAYTAEAVSNSLDGGKMMVRIADDDPGTVSTMAACAAAIDALAARCLPVMVEVFASHRTRDGRVTNLMTPAAMMRAIGIVAALGATSAYTWLKLPVFDEMEAVLSATTLPALLLGGDPGGDAPRVFARWSAAMELPQVRGLVVGRALLYPPDGDVAAAVDRAADIVARKVRV
jgi:hypothetical protein